MVCTRLCAASVDDWRRAVDTLSAEIHEIDRNATRIWFAFFPLDLHLALEAADDRAALEREARVDGALAAGRTRSTARTGSSTRIASGRR